MQKFSKKRWLSLAAGLLCFSLTAAAVTSYSWYFKPTTGHAIPEVIPEASRFIGDHAVIYLGSPEEKRVYLTFDAGYENGNVEKILNVLKEKNVPGAFFILPQLAKGKYRFGTANARRRASCLQSHKNAPRHEQNHGF